MKVIKKRGITFVKYIFLLLYAVITVFPLLWTFSNSFRTNDQIFTSVKLIPESFSHLDNYKNTLAGNVLQAYWNTFSLTIVSLVLILVCIVPCAYVLSMYRFKAAKWVEAFFMIGIILPRLSILVATFHNYNSWGLLGHKYPITLCYAAFEIAFDMYLTIGFMKSIPHEIAESAILDGCSSMSLLWRIIVPISSNGIITVIILAFTSVWNEYAYASILLTNVNYETLPKFLNNCKTEFAIDYGFMCSNVIVAVLPVIIVYCFLQNRIIDGMVAGAVKG